MIAVARVVEQAGGAGDTALLRQVAGNFLVGNPLLHTGQSAPLESRFDNFALNRLYAQSEGIDCLQLAQPGLVVLGNPPWEKIRLEERAFFRPLCPEISELPQKNQRAEKMEALKAEWPELADYYRLLQGDYAQLRKMIAGHPLLDASLVGERNTYALFAELACRLAKAGGFAAIIVKSALVTSTCYAPCFRALLKSGQLREVFLYENREKIFPIDSREKFCILFFGQSDGRGLDVHYNLSTQDEILTSVPLGVTQDILERINPETGMLPNVAGPDEFLFLLRAHRALPCSLRCSRTAILAGWCTLRPTRSTSPHSPRRTASRFMRGNSLRSTTTGFPPLRACPRTNATGQRLPRSARTGMGFCCKSPRRCAGTLSTRLFGRHSWTDTAAHTPCAGAASRPPPTSAP